MPAGYAVIAPLITPPSCYGKLPCLGDYFQHNAARAETGMWWTRFTSLLELALPWDAPAAWCFLLPRDFFSWSVDAHVAGVITLSTDRIGRRYPLVVWQKVTPKGLRHAALFGDEDYPHNWLFWLARLVTAFTTPQAFGISPEACLERSAVHFTEALEQLWELHRPRWSENFGLRANIDREAHCLRLTGLPAEEDIRGVHFMPWADWPERLWQGTPLCHFWQQDAQGYYLRAVVDRNMDTRVLAALFVK